MSHNYNQLYIHCIFRPKTGFLGFSPQRRQQILDYMRGICLRYDSKLECGFIMPDHVHLLLNIHPKHSVSEMIRLLKANTSHFLNQQPDAKNKFFWQEGYAAFSCSHSLLDTIKTYILGQETHHMKHKFEDEYDSLIKKHGLEVSP